MNFSQANILKVAAVAIAAPRYIGAFGASVGVSAMNNVPYLAFAEMATGAAMAILEGFALAFVLGKMRQLDPTSAHYKLLQRLAWFVAVTLPLVGLPYLLTEQTGQAIASLFASAGLIGLGLQIAWSFVLLSVPVAVVMAVGYADADEVAQATHRATTAAKVKQAKQAIQQQDEQDNLFVCECGRTFDSYHGLNGHRASCKIKQNGHNKTAEIIQ